MAMRPETISTTEQTFAKLPAIAGNRYIGGDGCIAKDGRIAMGPNGGLIFWVQLVGLPMVGVIFDVVPDFG